MKVRKVLSVALSLIMLLSILTACNSTPNTDAQTTPSGNTGDSVNSGAKDAEADVKEDEYRVLRVGSPSSVTVGSMLLRGPTTFTTQSAAVDFLSYSHLFHLNLETGEVEAELVDEYYWEDNTTLVMTLKEAYFSDGSPVTGWDVIATYRYPLDVGTSQARLVRQYDFDNSTVSDDGTTITLKYFEEFGPGVSYLTFGIMKAEFLEANYYDGSDNAGIEIWMDGNVVPHSGPYTRTEYVKDSYEVYKLREDYWDTSAQYDFDEIVIHQYSDATAMFIDFEAGNLDLVLDINETDYERVMSNGSDNLEGVIKWVHDVQTIVLNTDNPVFDDIRVRQAISYGCDTEALAVVAFGTLGVQATSILPSTCNYYSNVGAYEYDPDQARSLLEEAGVSGLELRFVVVNNRQQVDLITAFQSYMRDIGITINMEVYEQSTAAPMYVAGDSDFQLMQVNGGANLMEPHQILNSYRYQADIFPILGNVSFNCDDMETSNLLTEASTTLDTAKRAQLYAQAQQNLRDLHCLIPVVEYGYANAYNSDVVSKAYMPSSTSIDLRWVYAS